MIIFNLLRQCVRYLAILSAAWFVNINTHQFVEAQFSEFTSMWVFSDEVSDENDRKRLIQQSVASQIDTIYLSVYSPTENSNNRLMFEDANIADLIAKAKNHNIEVWAAYGNPDWFDFNCSGFPIDRMQEIVDYNQANPKQTFDGVILDVEPDGSQQDFMPGLLGLYDCVENLLHANDIKVAVAIRFFWDEPVQFPNDGQVKPGYEHVIDLDLDHVVVMGYRDFVGVGQPNGIVDLDEDEILYATSIGKVGHVLVGLETGECPGSCGGDSVTFYEEGQSALLPAIAETTRYFAPQAGFGGFSIHRYNGALFSGAKGWPARTHRSRPVPWIPR